MESYDDRLLRTLLVVVVLLCQNCYSGTYAPCTDPGWENPGYTYTIDRESTAVTWSFCKFPNPKVNHVLCGMPGKNGFRYICDPEHLLTQSEALAMDDSLGNMAADKTFPSVCEGTESVDERYVVAILLLDNIRVPDLSSNKTCTNKCGEVYPTLDRTLRQPSSVEKDVAMETFANSIRASLSIGQCENEAVVIYSRTLNRIFTSFGARLEPLFSSSNIASVHDAFIQRSTEGNDTLFDALGGLIKGYRREFKPTINPAKILLIICMIVVCGLAVFLYFFSHLKPVHVTAWEETLPWKITGQIFHVACGVWILEVIIFIVFYIERKAVVWQVLTLAAVFLSFIIVSGLFSGKGFGM